MDDDSEYEPVWTMSPESLAVQFHLEHIVSTLMQLERDHDAYLRTAWAGLDEAFRYQLFAFACIDLWTARTKDET